MRRIVAFILASSFLACASFSFLSGLSAKESLREALYYEKLENNIVRCRLCPRQCVIAHGKRGYCGVRENQDGALYTLVFAKPVAIHIDPIEKKPLFHVLPSTPSFSIATAGCNLKCKFCQNWEISQRLPEELESAYIEPKELVAKIVETGCPTIAYTYTEPTIFFEYMIETAKLAKEKGIRNVMHSAGYINEEPLRELIPYLSAANIDLKGFSDDYYRKMSDATLQPVLRTLKILKDAGVHVEITNLLVPGYNDDEETIKKMCVWIKDTLGADTPLHFSRFHPMYKLLALNPTPVESLEKARQTALDSGLRFVYIGNVPGHPAENTYCPRCKNMLIKRSGYMVTEVNVENGKCRFCGETISGIWK